MVKVSSTLKNRHFFTVKPFSAVLVRPCRASEGHFCINNVCILFSRNRKKCEKFKILLESCKVTSKLSADSFMDSWDLLVRQKSDFRKKFCENDVNPCRPPPG